ncbi:MAG: hypothetical protein WCQ49_00620 [Candidatus Saccharibacteria bacterium]
MKFDQEAQKQSIEKTLEIMGINKNYFIALENELVKDYASGGGGIYEFYITPTRKQKKKLKQNSCNLDRLQLAVQYAFEMYTVDTPGISVKVSAKNSVNIYFRNQYISVSVDYSKKIYI